eukprot:CAMPEP_0115178370 /NCGR_PEP_ID=MMETSP0270-20121206/5866_1 /TAXON_ID=71861 /ORGANISM="Scrippsiella trochoidea, Strain CCMP3099" /LENGTH=96 /DNA_ID=CAMNT_0002591331 /DNA_START=383 /DNA_END=669 /DNA_ORIENTATION=+
MSSAFESMNTNDTPDETTCEAEIGSRNMFHEDPNNCLVWEAEAFLKTVPCLGLHLKLSVAMIQCLGRNVRVIYFTPRNMNISNLGKEQTSVAMKRR